MRPCVLSILTALAASTMLGACNQTDGSGPRASATPSSATESGAREREKFLETPAGSEIELGNYAFWNRKCEARAFKLDVVDAPANGTVRLERSIITIYDNPTFGDGGGCAGRIIESKKLHYQPAAGFTGTDSFRVRAQDRSNIAIDNFEIKVY